jgi:transglutaminase-like putative cysteine protease
MRQPKLKSAILIWLSVILWSGSLGLAQSANSSDLILEPGDPPDSEVDPVVIADQNIDVSDATSPRQAHLTYHFDFTNQGPGDVTHLDVYVAIPPSRKNQKISNLVFSSPYTLLTDRYGQQIAYFQFETIASGEHVTVSWEGDVEIAAKDYGVDPSKVGGFDLIPSDIISTYTTAESMYRLDSQIIQDAAKTAANGATNPYWIARNIHDFVANRLTYLNDHVWDDAETVYLQQHGSCSEYTTLFIALCRANGLPARYVGGTRQREEGTYVDTVYHRWAEVYLPPYGWIPIDVNHDDTNSGVRYTYFGAITDERFVTTVGGGNSEYLGWNYHDSYRYYYSGSLPSTDRERSFTWEPYVAPNIAVAPTSITKYVLSNTSDSLIGNLDITSTDGSAMSWEEASSPGWLYLNKSSGTTPDSGQVWVDTSGLSTGRYRGEIVFQSQPSGSNVSVTVNLLLVDELFELYLPIIKK